MGTSFFNIVLTIDLEVINKIMLNCSLDVIYLNKIELLRWTSFDSYVVQRRNAAAKKS